MSLFDTVVLTPAEDLVTEALRIIEPGIERIAAAVGDRGDLGSRYSIGRGGILVKLKGVRERVPIGSMGDGIWRLLGIALSVVQASGGLLLVDEIDSGLHHTVMEQMWKFLDDCSQRFDVQIVATTHSRDCFQSLATVCQLSTPDSGDITIHRIERGQTESVAYTGQEIIAAAELGLEVR
jgi:ABC-type taurine transport system ATPase subunit